MTTLLLLHAVVGLVVVGVGRRLGAHPGRCAIVAAVPLAATVVWLATSLADVVDGRAREEHVEWIPQLGIGFHLRLDGMAALMAILVAGIGVLVMAYASRYLLPGDPRTGRLIGLLTLFGGAMFGLVIADDLLVLYGFWELTSITSFLLIGNDHDDPKARAAALHAVLVTGLGSLAMLAGFILLGQAAGTYRLSELVADPPGGGTVTVALLLVVLGALTKSAQYPFHSWLPGAMVAPTPVSVYLHSATMVKAGVYLVARLAPAFADTGSWRPVVVTAGIVTMIGGGLRALRQTDLKLLLAMGTVSQLGFMVAVFGWGSPTATAAGCVLVLAHGLFKAAAFMVVGAIEHETGTRDLRAISRRGGASWLAKAVAILAAASMAGIPLLFGFVAKDSAFEAFVDRGTSATVVLVGLVTGSLLTAGYSARFAAGSCGWLADEAAPTRPATAAVGLLAPAGALAALGVLFGIAPQIVGGLVDSASRSLGGAPTGVAAWHGLTEATLLSFLVLTGGAAIYLGRQPIGSLLAAGGRLPTAAGAYRTTLRLVNGAANRVTAVAQPGSLPIYVGVIALCAAIVPATLMVSARWWSGWPDAVTTAIHVPVAAAVVGAALAAAVVRRRFTAALFLGVVGYSMAALFVVQGAPDLALTQVAIETLTTVLFVLVLRRLPDRFEDVAGRPRRLLRLAVATVVGVSVFVLTLGFGSQDPATTVSDEMAARSLPDGEGRNIVNVILVDFRGVDTLGELTVLAAAAIGTVALARAGRRARPGQFVTDPGPAVEGAAERLPPPVELSRQVTLEVSVRIVFAAVVVGSLWLLFAGHNQPGGGFVGGIVAAAAVSLRYVAGGLTEVRQLSRSRPWIVLGAGVLLAVAVAGAPLLLGGSVLEGGSTTFDLPVFGSIKLTSALAFDIGVYLAVVGLALMVFESFGDDSQPARART